jgi:hypothetical protein
MKTIKIITDKVALFAFSLFIIILITASYFFIFDKSAGIVIFDYFSKKINPTHLVELSPNYTFKFSEGNCKKTSDCEWAGEGCGGGHGMCTNNPGYYKNSVSTCDVNPFFPANQGYSCTCISTVEKCGWKK